MPRPALLTICCLLLSVGTFFLSLNGCGGSRPGTAQNSKVQHVVIIFQENRTPDNLFQDQKLIANGADIQNFGVNSKGQTIPLTPIDLGTSGSNPGNYDLNHQHSAFLDMCDLNPSTNVCKMDGADLIGVSCGLGVTGCAPANPQFKYVTPADVGPYFQLAEQYTFADRMFQTNQGPSFPAHQFIIAGTSAPGARQRLVRGRQPHRRTQCRDEYRVRRPGD